MYKFFFKSLISVFCLLSFFECFPKKLIMSPILNLPTFLRNREKLFKINNYSNVANRIKRIVIVCPYSVSGGPENLCQMFSSFNKLGFETYFLWVKEISKVVKRYNNYDKQWYLCKDAENTFNTAYSSDYGVNSLFCNIPLNKETLVILPELWADYVYFFDGAIQAIAWLSINNFYYADSILIDSFIKQKKLDSCGCIHLAQAPWVKKILQTWGAESFLIGDYISKIYLNESKSLKIQNTIAFYPRKGGDLAKKFIESCSNYNFVPLVNLDQQGMIKVLDSAQIYIDFGDFPGKDRTPREALSRDCVIFIHNQNCATDFDSFPIDDYFRFTEEDISNGNLLKKVQEVLLDYENMKKRQDFMRNQVLQEPELFEQRVKEFIGQPLK